MSTGNSRLIVKNLPKFLSEDKLKKHFSSQGSVTDAKIMYKDGVSRKFGFIGYKTEEEARKAAKFFNGTFLHTSKLDVSEAKP